MMCTESRKFHDNIKFLRTAGYLDRDPNFLKNRFYAVSEDYKKIYEFITAIKYLAKNNNGYDIVVRPHPQEDIDSWKIFLENVPNVHVIREDSITAWVKNTFAVMHNGCTTALEATISGKPVLTFSPFEMEYANELFNTLGYQIKSKEDLLLKANELFKLTKSNSKKMSIKNSEMIFKRYT